MAGIQMGSGLWDLPLDRVLYIDKKPQMENLEGSVFHMEIYSRVIRIKGSSVDTVFSRRNSVTRIPACHCGVVFLRLF